MPVAEWWKNAAPFAVDNFKRADVFGDHTDTSDRGKFGARKVFSLGRKKQLKIFAAAECKFEFRVEIGAVEVLVDRYFIDLNFRSDMACFAEMIKIGGRTRR